MSTPAPEVLVVKATLRDSKPPIWRRLEILSDTTLDEVDGILQVAFGWDGWHLHHFVIKDGAGLWGHGTCYSDPSTVDEADDEAEVTLEELFAKKGPIWYEYDFGDSWEHRLVLEKRLPQDPREVYPRCVKAVGAAPLEDCGGIFSWQHLVASVSDPSAPDYAERAAQLLETWSLTPAELLARCASIEEINAELHDDD